MPADFTVFPQEVAGKHWYQHTVAAKIADFPKNRFPPDCLWFHIIEPQPARAETLQSRDNGDGHAADRPRLFPTPHMAASDRPTAH
jgi:hypothetical protein